MSAVFSAADHTAPSDNFLERLTALLNLAKQPDSEADLANVIPLRMELGVLDNLLREGLTPKELSIVLPLRTLTHRRAKNQPLSPDESDRALRIARLLALAEIVFNDRDKALAWLRRPLKRFRQRSPMQMMVSELGGRQVEETLIQIDEGYAA